MNTRRVFQFELATKPGVIDRNRRLITQKSWDKAIHTEFIQTLLSQNKLPITSGYKSINILDEAVSTPLSEIIGYVTTINNEYITVRAYDENGEEVLTELQNRGSMAHMIGVGHFERLVIGTGDDAESVSILTDIKLTRFDIH